MRDETQCCTSKLISDSARTGCDRASGHGSMMSECAAYALEEAIQEDDAQEG